MFGMILAALFFVLNAAAFVLVFAAVLVALFLAWFALRLRFSEPRDEVRRIGRRRLEDAFFKGWWSFSEG
ncbi:MAG: hypothetical protein WDN10_05245 [bacterium]